jgi:hypothetical protein
MHSGGWWRERVIVRGRRGLTAGLVAALALLVAGCGSGAGGGGSAGGADGGGSAGAAPIVTAEQVVTACFHDYFYNGILPESAARSNCTHCVVQELRKLRIEPSAGETELDVLTGVRLSSSSSQQLQGACTEADASAQ